MLIVICLLSIVVHPIFAQSSSQSELCPPGTKAVVKGADIECVQTSTVKKICPDGTYQGRDNQGNFACRDIKSNQIVDPNTGLMFDSQTGNVILDDSQIGGLVTGIIILIIIIAVIAKAVSSKSNSNYQQEYASSEYVPRRGWTEIQKEDVRIRQNGKCNKCGRPPPRWEYHHRDGDRSNNSLRNCEGLCPNCHSVKTHDG